MLVPMQIVAAVELMLNEGCTTFERLTIIALDVTCKPEAQAKPDVTITFTASPFKSELLVKLEAFVPMLIPFTCH